MPNALEGTTPGREPEIKLKTVSTWTGKGQHKTPAHSDYSSKEWQAFVTTEGNGSLKNLKCPICGAIVRYQPLGSLYSNLVPACENPDCGWTIDFLSKQAPKPKPDVIKMRQLRRFAKGRC